MCQAIDGARITYDEMSMKSIERISEDAENGQLIFTMTDGEERRYAAKHNYDDQYHIIEDQQTIIAAFDNDGSINTIEYFFRKAFPEWRNYVYWDVLADRATIDMQIIGGDGVQAFAGTEDLTRIWKAFNERQKFKDQNGRERTIRATSDMMIRTINLLASDNPKNPFIEYINKMSADPSEPVHNIDYFLSDMGMSASMPGISDEDADLYLKKVSRAIFLSVIERQMTEDPRPFRFIPIIHGEQGNGKSTLCRKLGFVKWHMNTKESLDDDKKFFESINGAVIVELNEGVPLRKSNEDCIKAFLDHTHLQYRKSYARDSTRTQIRFLMIATTNDDEILTDLTGNSRYYPIFNRLSASDALPVDDLDDATMCGYWANAIEQYKGGARWDDGFTDPHFLKICKKMQDRILHVPAGLDEVKKYLDEEYPEIGDRIAIQDIETFIRNELQLQGKEKETLMNQVRKSMRRFGFSDSKSVRPKYHSKDVSKGYERIRVQDPEL